MLGTQLGHSRPGGPPGERVRAALADPDPIARAAALVPVLRDLEISELGDVEQAYRDSFAGTGPRDTAIALLSEAWAALDPAGALERTSSWSPAARVAAQKALLRAWARRNRNAAMEWIAGIRDDGSLSEAVFGGWAESGDPAMWQRRRRDDAGHGARVGVDRDDAMGSVARGIRGACSRAWRRCPTTHPTASSRPRSAPRRRSSRITIPSALWGSPIEQAEGPYGSGLLQRIANHWVVHDGPAAMQDLLDRPVSKDRDAALREAYITWLRRNHAAAMAWMPESAPLDVRFTPLVDIYAVAIANNDPEHRSDAIRRAIRVGGANPGSPRSGALPSCNSA